MAGKLIAENRRARYDYFLEQSFEAGLALTGSKLCSRK
jgi:SsrA-binding protein